MRPLLSLIIKIYSQPVKVSFILLISLVVACVGLGNYLYYLSATSFSLYYNEWTVVDEKEIIIFNKNQLASHYDFQNKSELAQAKDTKH